MKKLALVVFAATLIIYACGGGAESSSTSSTSTTPVAEAKGPDGKKVFGTYCVACHGVWGDMKVNGAANLRESQLSLEERIAIITNGKEGTQMVAYKNTLDEAQIKAVAEHTMTLKD